jgi:hypothetical protein
MFNRSSVQVTLVVLGGDCCEYAKTCWPELVDNNYSELALSVADAGH